MRKYLIAGVVTAAAVAGVTTTALGQEDTGADMTVKVAPKNAGTAKKPTNSSLGLTVNSHNHRAVLTKLAIHIPKTLAVSGKGFPTCKKSKLDNNSSIDSKGRPTACKSSRIGSGSAQALGGINTSSPFPVSFVVTPIAGPKNQMFFYLHGTNIAVNVVSPGKLKKTSSGYTLTVTVPPEAQNIGGLWNGLVQIKTLLKAKSGKHLLIATTGCKGKSHKFSTDLTFGQQFVQDPADPTVYDSAPGYKRTVTDDSPCTK